MTEQTAVEVDTLAKPDSPEPLSSTSAPLLSVKDLGVTFDTGHGPVLAVDSVNLDLHRGRSLGVVGESGSGKSVMCRAVMNILAPNASVTDESRIAFEGKDLDTLTPKQRKHFWGVEVAMIFQDPMTSLTPVLTVGKQIMEPLIYHRRMSKSKARAAALELLEQTGIPDPRRRLDQYPHNLSGGMRQRVSIAIALACEPKLLIADEPTTALDVTVQQQILNLLTRLQKERNMGLLLISHDLGVIASRTDDVMVMYAGQVVEQGETASVMSDPRHPYTRGLLESIPRLDRPRHGRLHTIPGRITPRRETGEGCYFAPRCARAQPSCLTQLPTLEQDEGSHRYACFFPAGTETGDEALATNRRQGHTATGLLVGSEGSS